MATAVGLGEPPGASRAAADTSRSRVVRSAQRLVLRTAGSPLERVWVILYWAIARAGARYLAWGERGAAAYVRGGLGADDFVPALSDIDVALVLAEDPAGRWLARRRAERRWQRLIRALPGAKLLLDEPRIYEDRDLRELVGASALTSGLGADEERGSPPVACLSGAASFDDVKALVAPGLYGATMGWRPLAGPDRRPPEPGRDRQAVRIAGWLELVHWWRYAFPACVDRSGPRTAHLCVKLVSESARVWLWLAHGERAAGRADALVRALRKLPEEERALRRALALLRSLPRSPEPPLAETLAALVRLTERVVALVEKEAADQGFSSVRLAGADGPLLVPGVSSGRDEPGQRLLALADWRALAWPLQPDESLLPLPGDPGDPVAVGAAAASHPVGPYPVLRRDGLLVLPATPLWRNRLRAVQCRITDPVSFALLDGDRVAGFPQMGGWSALDTARRAVAEHGNWLQMGAESLGTLFTAARAALFLDSIRAGDPELPLTVTETARRLADESPAARGAVEEGLERYRELVLNGRQPPAGPVSALRGLVSALPAYTER